MIAEEKLKLIEKIRQTEDSVLLSEIGKLMNLSTNDETYKLSDDQINSIQVAEDQIKSGDVLTHEEAKKESDKWFDKSFGLA